MANLNSTSVWEVRTTGSDSNGGMFNAAGSGAGTDYSQQNSPQLSLTDVVTNGTTTVTSSTGGFTAAMVRNGINIAGTVYEISGYTNSNTITVVGSPASGTGQTGNTGGALGSPGYCGSQIVTGNTIYLTGTLLVTSASANVSGGTLLCNNLSGSYLTVTSFICYGTTRGDGGTATIRAGVANALLLSIQSCAYITFENLILDGNKSNFTGTRNTSFGGSNYSELKFLGCQFTGSGSDGMSQVLDGCIFVSCQFYNNTGVGCNGGRFGSGLFGCSFYSNGSDGLLTNVNGCVVVRCISYSNSGCGFNDSSSSSYNPFVECTAYGNASDGFHSEGDLGASPSWINNLSVSNGGKGFNTYNSLPDVVMRGCAAYNNTGGSGGANINLTGNPFINAAGGNFALNDTAGAGAACRAAGVPGTFPGGTTTGYLDIGAVQHQDSGSGGGLIVLGQMNGGMG